MVELKLSENWAALPSTARATPSHVSFDKKSNRIAYAANQSIHLRSVSDPKVSSQFTGHVAATTVAKFSPSGFYVASGDASGNVKVWDCVGEDQVVKGDYPVISGRINDLDWDGDSQRIIAAGDGKERYGHCFTMDSGNSVGEISGHSAPINGVSIKKNRPYRAVTVSDDGNVVFYTGPPFKFNKSLKDVHSNFVHDAAFSPDGKYIASVGADRKIALYDGKEGTFLRQVGDAESGHTGSIFSLNWLPSGERFLSAGADCKIKLWDATEGKLVREWTFDKQVDNHQVAVVVVSDNEFITVSLSGDITYFSLDSDTPTRVITGHQKAITALAVSPDGSKLYTGSYDGRVVSWDVSTGSSVRVENAHSNLVVGIVPCGSKFVSCGWDDELKTLEGDKFVESKSLKAQPKGLAAYDELVAVVFESEVATYGSSEHSAQLSSAGTAVAVSGKYIAVGTADFAITIYDHELTRTDFKPKPLRAKPTALAFSRDGKYLAAGEAQGKITVYDTSDFSVVTSRWQFNTGQIKSIAWSPDGKRAVAGSLDTSIAVYSLETPGRVVKYGGAHKQGVNAVAWLSDSKIVSAGADACIKFWDLV